MSKTTMILSTAVLAAGMLGVPNVVVSRVAAMGVSTIANVEGENEPTQLRENTNDEFFKILRLDPNAGMVRLNLTIPDGQKLKQVVAARPGEDRYRMMGELDKKALGILDGEVEGLILVETENIDAMVLGQTFDNWVGFSMYGDEGMRTRNPADVIYIGVTLQDTETGEEMRYYHKINYRGCAHQDVVLKGEIIMCEARHEGGKTEIFPEASEILNKVPTWEEELLELAQGAVKEYFEDLEEVEAKKAEGTEVGVSEIETLEGESVEMKAVLAKFPVEIEEIVKLGTDFETRVAVLRDENSNGVGGSTSGTQGGSAGAGGTGVGSTGAAPTMPLPIIPSVDVTKPTTAMTSVATAMRESDAEKDGEASATAPELVAVDATLTTGDQVDNDNGMAVPKLGGAKTWLGRYGLALLIAGASIVGVMGWFLIGLIGKRRKQER